MNKYAIKDKKKKTIKCKKNEKKLRQQNNEGKTYFD